MKIVQRKRAKEESKGRDMHIPQDIFEEILLRLEVKDLLRFKSVCHGWYDVISSSNFIQRQLQQSMADSEQNHCRICQNFPLITIDYNSCFDKESVKRIRNQTFPLTLLSSWDDWLQIMGSCDGLICLSSNPGNRRNKLFIWNPCLGELLTIPKPDYLHREEFYWFGRDNSIKTTGTYKIVMGIGHCTRDLGEHFVIYTLKSNGSSYNWREIEEKLCECVNPRERGTFLNGIVHWPTLSVLNQDRQRQVVVVAYDLSLEKIGKIPAPPNNVIPSSYFSSFTLGVFDECLCAIFNPAETFEIWIMKEYGLEKSWTMLIKLEESRVERHFWCCRPIGYLKNGDLLVDFDGNTLVRYSISTTENRTAKFVQARNHKFGDDPITLVESLISPHGIVFD